MTTQELQTELAKSDYTGLSNADATALLNTRLLGGMVYVPNGVAFNYLSRQFIWDKLSNASTDFVSPNEEAIPTTYVRGRIRTFLATITIIGNLDFEPYKSVIPSLVELGIITQGEADGFMALAYVPITEQEVAAARCYDQWLTESATLATMQGAVAAQQMLVNALSVGDTGGG